MHKRDNDMQLGTVGFQGALSSSASNANRIELVPNILFFEKKALLMTIKEASKMAVDFLHAVTQYIDKESCGMCHVILMTR